jgi:predicted PurR-regulated permease PerM
MIGDKQTLDISTSSILRVFFVLLLVGFVFVIWQILASIFLAVVVAAALEPAVRGLGKVKIPRLLGAVMVYTVALAVLVAVFYAIVPALAVEVRQLSLDLPARYTEFIENIGKFFGTTPGALQIEEQIKGVSGSFRESLSGGFSNIFSFTFNVFGGLTSFLFVFVVSFYLVLQRNGLEHFLRSFLPAAHQEYVISVWTRVQQKLGRWFQGQLLLALFVGVLMFLALWLMGVKYALTLAFVAGVLELIPVIGPITVGFIALALVSFQSPLLAIGATLAYLVIQQIQQYLLAPIVISKTVGVNPIVLVIALLVAVKIIGFWGVLLAVPLSITLSEVVRDFRK